MQALCHRLSLTLLFCLTRRGCWLFVLPPIASLLPSCSPPLSSVLFCSFLSSKLHVVNNVRILSVNYVLWDESCLHLKRMRIWFRTLPSFWTSTCQCARICVDLSQYSKDKYAAIIKDSPWILHSALITSHETNYRRESQKQKFAEF